MNWPAVIVLVVCFSLFLALRAPVAIAMIATGVVAILFVAPRARLENLVSIGADQSMAFVFTVVPLFVLMGEVLRRTTVAADLFTVGDRLLRRVPGGMLHASVLGCAGFAAVSGSSPVTASTVGSLAIPQMLRAGYPPRLAAGVVAAGGTLGILIPPSIGLIVYGVITGTSIGALFLAGILPGILLTALFMLITVLVLPLNKRRMRETEIQGAERVSSVTMVSAGASTSVARVDESASSGTTLERDAVRTGPTSIRVVVAVASVVTLFGAVIGGIYTGVTTPTESAALGAFGALVIGYAVGGLRSTRQLLDAFTATALTTGMFVLLLVAGLFVAYVVTVIGIPQQLALTAATLDLPGWLVIVLIAAILVVLGMFLDPMSMVIIMAPVLLPTVTALGYSPVWFGVLFIITVEVGMITPPVGFNLFVLKRVVPELRFGDIVAGSATYLPAFALAIVALLLFPEIALFLTQQ